MENVVFEFEKSGNEVVRFRVSEFRGSRYADVRIWFEGDDGELRPTKRGVCVPTDSVEDLVKGVEKLQEALDR